MQKNFLAYFANATKPGNLVEKLQPLIKEGLFVEVLLKSFFHELP